MAQAQLEGTIHRGGVATGFIAPSPV